MKIGIMGGTFNPPHKGHKNIIKEAYKNLNLDKIYVIPNNKPSHKNMPKNSPSAKNRFEMCEIMCADLEYTEVSDIEIKKGGLSYTIETLRELKNEEDELFLIIGSDSFFDIEKWIEFEEIFKLCTLVVFKRIDNIDLSKHQKYLTEKYNIKSYIIKTVVLEVSSTEIREENSNILAIDKINNYILEKNLYKE